MGTPLVEALPVRISLPLRRGKSYSAHELFEAA